jgi:hypothetical protein
MSAGEHLDRGQWPLLLSLVPGDQERAAAEAHAAGCQSCELDRREAAALLADLGSLPMPPPPRAEVLQRAAAAVHRAFEAERANRKQVPWIEALAVAGAFGLVVGIAVHSPGAPIAAWAPALVLLGAAALVPWLVQRFGGWGIALAGLSVPFAFARATDMHLALDLGATCLVMEALAATLPVVTLVSVARGRGSGFGSWTFAAAAASGALAGQAALLLSCPSHELGHLLFIHTGTVLAAALAGAGVPRLVPALAPA